MSGRAAQATCPLRRCLVQRRQRRRRRRRAGRHRPRLARPATVAPVAPGWSRWRGPGSVRASSLGTARRACRRLARRRRPGRGPEDARARSPMSRSSASVGKTARSCRGRRGRRRRCRLAPRRAVEAGKSVGRHVGLQGACGCVRAGAGRPAAGPRRPHRRTAERSAGWERLEALEPRRRGRRARRCRARGSRRGSRGRRRGSRWCPTTASSWLVSEPSGSVSGDQLGRR